MSERKLKLLCLDGGGVRGLASLMLLKQILAHAGNPKPCDYFDMIGGTSTGGLIAIMLGRLEMTVDDCIIAFTEMMDKIFRKTHSLPFNLLGRVQSRFDADVLVQCIKSILDKEGVDPEALMRGPKKSHCKTFVVAMSGEARTEVYFTDYEVLGEQRLFTQVKIWEAARATSAATSFFEPTIITVDNISNIFLDGAFHANNPVFELWSQASQEFGSSPLEPRIQFILSLGTGKPQLEAFGRSMREIGQSIIKIAAETEKTARRFGGHNWQLADRNGYFRFNPPDIAKIGLEDSKSRGTIAARVQAYATDPDFKAQLRRFEAVVRGESVETPPVVLPPSSPPIAAKRFYDLGRGQTYIRPGAKSYWSRLTLTSYEIYEAVIDQCIGSNGLVYFPTFTSQFNHDTTPLKQISSTWARLLRAEVLDPSTSFLPRGLAMAVIYMLHIERQLRGEMPCDEYGRPGLVKRNRRELLKRYDRWVVCLCDASSKGSSSSSSSSSSCGVLWNFAGDVGMWRREGGGGGGGDDGKTRKGKERCEVVRLMGRGTLALGAKGKEVETLERIRMKWVGGQVG